VKQRVYFFLWGTTREMSLTSRRIGSFPFACEAPVAVPFDVASPFVPFSAGRLGRSSSRRRFLEAGSESARGIKEQTWREIWLKSSM